MLKLNNNKLLKSFKYKIKKSLGKNNSGKITVRHKGGGNKKLYVKIIFKRTLKHKGFVDGFFYDPYRSSFISLIKNEKFKFLIIAPNNLKIGDFIESSEKKLSKIGDNTLLKNIPIGSLIHNISLKSNTNSKLIRAAGTSAQLIQIIDKRYAKIRLQSKELRLIDSNSTATIGSVSNTLYNFKKLYKAGQNRWLNRRPKVRGVAKNPIDHPHGGGEGKTSGGRSSISYSGILSKGFKTRKYKNKFVLK